MLSPIESEILRVAAGYDVARRSDTEADRSAIAALVDAGLIASKEGTVTITPKGRAFIEARTLR